jgi:hypothetical protein
MLPEITPEAIPASIEIENTVFDVIREVSDVKDETKQDVIRLEANGQVYLLSPNTTAEELLKYSDPCEKGHVL